MLHPCAGEQRPCPRLTTGVASTETSAFWTASSWHRPQVHWRKPEFCKWKWPRDPLGRILLCVQQIPRNGWSLFLSGTGLIQAVLFRSNLGHILSQPDCGPAIFHNIVILGAPASSPSARALRRNGSWRA